MMYFEAFFHLLFHGLLFVFESCSCIEPIGHSHPQTRRLPMVANKNKMQNVTTLALTIPCDAAKTII
jgi:hypothetical protein